MAKPTDYTEEEIAQAIEECGGYISGIAKRLGTSCEAIGAFIKSRPELRDLQLDMQEEMLDEAEKGLRKAVYAEKAWAIQFVLSRLGKRRGYGQKLEVEASVDSASRVVVYLPDDGREAKATDGDSTATGATDAGVAEQS